jgi:hypothetical protein
MWTALLWNWAAFVAFGFLLIWVRYTLERFQQQLDERYALAALQGWQGGLGAATSGEAVSVVRADGKAVASFVLGVLALLFAVSPFVAAVAIPEARLNLAGLMLPFLVFWPITGFPAIVLGHIARSKIKKSGGRLTGERLALLGLAFGYLTGVPAALFIGILVSYLILMGTLSLVGLGVGRFSPQLAYIATWIIHISYILILTLMFRQLKRGSAELPRGQE